MHYPPPVFSFLDFDLRAVLPESAVTEESFYKHKGSRMASFFVCKKKGER